jgi:flagellar motor switch protein FliG
MVRDVEESLARRLRHAEPGGGSGGVEAAASILQHVGGAAEQAVLDGLAGEAPELAQTIRRRLMAFEDLDRLPLEQWSAALDSLDSEDLAVALRTAGKRLRRRVLSTVSPAVAQRVRRQMEQIGPVRLSDVEAAQLRVVEAVRRFEPGQYTPQRAPDAVHSASGDDSPEPASEPEIS